jgi:hypothetical protein
VPGQRCAPKRWIWPVGIRLRRPSTLAGLPRTDYGLVRALMQNTYGASAMDPQRYGVTQGSPTLSAWQWAAIAQIAYQRSQTAGRRSADAAVTRSPGSHLKWRVPISFAPKQECCRATTCPSVDGAGHVGDPRPRRSATLGTRIRIGPLPGDDGPYGSIRIGSSEGRMNEDTRLPLDRGPLSGGHALVLRRAP